MAANILHFWYMAQESPHGVWLQTTDPTRLKSVLYAARAKSHDPSIASIAIRTAPNNTANEIWLVKGPPIEGLGP